MTKKATKKQRNLKMRIEKKNFILFSVEKMGLHNHQTRALTNFFHSIHVMRKLSEANIEYNTIDLNNPNHQKPQYDNSSKFEFILVDEKHEETVKEICSKYNVSSYLKINDNNKAELTYIDGGIKSLILGEFIQVSKPLISLLKKTFTPWFSNNASKTCWLITND